MKTPLFTVLAFAFASTVVRAQVTLNPAKCFTLSTGGSLYLDSTNSVLAIQSHTNRTALEAGTDKGVRFHFPTGEGGWVVCEAHNDHYVGTSIPPSNWNTELATGSTSELATIHITPGSGSKKAYVNATPRHFVGENAEVAASEFDWDILPINCLVN
ncbi:hypothetical protein C8F01DRAFT_1064847 [Mycena amicta]|nr:hypothetical protein C8F01DRAFT_1064847 [Mycena amicta]